MWPAFKGVAPVVHVLVAVFTFFLLASSWWMMALPLPSQVFTYRVIPFQLHKNVGLTIVVFVLVMLGARLSHAGAKRAAATPARRMPRSAVIQHVLLYGLVLACAASGYLSSAYSGWTTRWWWMVDLPNWGYDNDELNILWSAVHSWTYYGLLALVAVHVGLTMHRAFRGDRGIRRMLHL